MDDDVATFHFDREAFDPVCTGAEMHERVRRLYPICRSITGAGLRETLADIRRDIPLEIREVPSGTAVFDWTVPDEWNIREAWIKNARGETVVDFRNSNLHVVGYSVPVRARMSLAELKPHLHSLPDRPDWIPYRTSYYQEQWGFCLPHAQLQKLEEGEYEVFIDSTRAPGSLSYGELALPGESPDEVLVSCHVCHPSLCNDNLSGLAVCVRLAQELVRRPHRLSYRFLFIPGTIGSITWLALNEARTANIRHGLVVAGVGDAGRPVYKQSRRGDALIDRAMAHVLSHRPSPGAVQPFAPYGYDERQYGSPGFDLPVGLLMRTPFGQYPEYHTSADNLDFVRPSALAETFELVCAAFEILESNRRFTNVLPKCEPQLGRRGLYDAVGGRNEKAVDQMALLWVLNQSDGSRDLLGIAERAGLPYAEIRRAAELLRKKRLLAV
ncbi:MAG TPA: peptidase M28 [Verrucomicrobia bacterium]|nr:peptidase M28 [Verrucomicrobiota bacterium]